MKKIFTLCLLAIAIACAAPTMAQAVKLNTPSNDVKKVYDPKRDAMKDLEKAIMEANATHRYVLCQVGGNWCPWCLKFIDFVEKDEEISKFIKENYVYVHVNYSRENKNLDVMKRLGNPGRFGYPVFVILNEEGNVIHIQNSAYLEADKSYDHKKVLEFLANWTDKAIKTLK